MRYGGFNLAISNRGNEEFSLVTDKYFEGRTARLLVADTQCLRREEL